jgi:hypothetical protein
MKILDVAQTINIYLFCQLFFFICIFARGDLAHEFLREPYWPRIATRVLRQKIRRRRQFI